MKGFLRVVLYIIVLLIVVVVGFVGFLEVRGIPKYEVEKVNFPTVQGDSSIVANGRKIASVQCMYCHMGSDNKLSGRLLFEFTDFGEIHSANITQSKEHGIGSWSDENIAYLLRTGCKPTGQFVPPYMPKFAHMSDYDLKSVIAFVRSSDPCVQASEIPAVPPKPNLLAKFLCLVQFKKIPYPKEEIPIPDTNNAVALGKYLVTARYDCYPCHSADFKTMDMVVPEHSGGYLGGGNKMIANSRNVRQTANITPDEETGIGKWTEEDFANAMLHSKNKEGKSLRSPMLPYNGMSQQEIKAIWAYLQTVPKIKNNVDRKWNED